MSDVQKVVAYYDQNAKDLAERYAAQSPEKLHGRLTAVLDAEKIEGPILEIGGGVGRDADFFGRRYRSDVTVIEPSEALMQEMESYLTGRGYAPSNTDMSSNNGGKSFIVEKDGIEIACVQYTLDQMAEEVEEDFDPDTIIPRYAFINVNAVWQHQPAAGRPRAATALIHLLEEGGILSVKGRDRPSPEQAGVAWNVTAEELAQQFSDLEIIEIEEQPDYSKPGSDLKFISAVFRKPNGLYAA